VTFEKWRELYERLATMATATGFLKPDWRIISRSIMRAESFQNLD